MHNIKILRDIQMDSTLEILEKVNAFYIGAFDQLIILTVSVLAFCGVLVPILISTYQNKQLKLQQEALERLIA